MIGPPGKRDKATPPPDYLSVAVTFERPDLDGRSSTSSDRDGIFKARSAQAATFRDHLVAWLDEQHLLDEVYRVSEPTAFSTLFVVASPLVVERLDEAPGVVEVSETGESDFTLLR